MRTHAHVGEGAKRGITRGQEKVLREVEGREGNDVVRQKRDQLCRTRDEEQSDRRRNEPTLMTCVKVPHEPHYSVR